MVAEFAADVEGFAVNVMECTLFRSLPASTRHGAATGGMHFWAATAESEFHCEVKERFVKDPIGRVA